MCKNYPPGAFESEAPWNTIDKEDICEYCNNTKQIECEYCLGTGIDEEDKINCRECKGSGVLICKKC